MCWPRIGGARESDGGVSEKENAELLQSVLSISVGDCLAGIGLGKASFDLRKEVEALHGILDARFVW